MYKLFDLEEKIMNCWSILDDIDTALSIAERTNCNEDKVCNALIGIKTLYQTKFEILFESLEEVIGDRYKATSVNYCNNAETVSTGTIVTSSTENVGRTTTISFK
jgi:hypothetical protein